MLEDLVRGEQLLAGSGHCRKYRQIDALYNGTAVSRYSSDGATAVEILVYQ
jgi:hypothetical protein